MSKNKTHFFLTLEAEKTAAIISPRDDDVIHVELGEL